MEIILNSILIDTVLYVLIFFAGMKIGRDMSVQKAVNKHLSSLFDLNRKN